MKTETIRNREIILWRLAAGACLVLLGFAASCARTADNRWQGGQPAAVSAGGTVVVSEGSDPYRTLAERIAREEKIELLDDIARALEGRPRYVILVAAPENLTEQKLVDIGGLFLRDDYFPGFGIISGSTIEHAEHLWERRGPKASGGAYLGGDVEEGQAFEEPAIFRIGGDSPERTELTRETLTDSLARAGFFYWSRHVTENKWFWNSTSESFGEDDKLFGADLPELDSPVIYTPSCGSFQPWTTDSIALAFVDRGAAAYLGHVRSPCTNAFLLRRGFSVPGILTWREFPLSIAAQIENRMTARAVFRTPMFFMLGDPRLYLSEERPYRIDLDASAGKDRRRIRGWSGNTGVLAVKIAGGAGYGFVEIRGLSAAADDDLFYNYRVQSMGLGADKFVLFLHDGGDFEMELSRQAPPLWKAADTVLDVLDYSWTVISPVQGPFAFLHLAVFLAVLFWKTLRRKHALGEYRTVVLLGLTYSMLRSLYVLLRIDDYSVSANIAEWSAADLTLGFLGSFACAAGGLTVMRDAGGAIAQAAGLLLAVLPQLFLTAFYFISITFTNAFYMSNSATPLGIWNYRAFWLPFLALAVEAGLVTGLHRLANRPPAGSPRAAVQG
ncbi:MAG: hypothetical protein JW929_04165 [Anaerolineales bacterium]|nr:hypothetical protein [Anaerolineales bacterium]